MGSLNPSDSLGGLFALFFGLLFSPSFRATLITFECIKTIKSHRELQVRNYKLYVTIEGEFLTQAFYFMFYTIEYSSIVNIFKSLGNKSCEEVHLWFSHPTSRDRGCPDADPRWIERFAWIERNHVFIGTNSDFFEHFFRLLSGESVAPKNINDEKVIIGSSGDDSESIVCETFREYLCISDHLLGIGLELRSKCLTEGDSFGSDEVLMRSSLYSWEYGTSEGRSESFASHDNRSSWTTEGFVCGGRDDVTVGNRIREGSTGDETRDMGDICHEVGTNFVGDVAESCPVKISRVCGKPSNDHTRFRLHRDSFDLIHVDHLRLFVDPIGDDLVEKTGEIQRMSMRQVSTLIETHPENRVARLQEPKVDGKICGRTRERLDVDIFGPEQRTSSLNREILYLIDVHLPRIVSFPRIPLGVFIHEYTSRRFHNRFRRVVFGCDEFELVLLTSRL